MKKLTKEQKTILQKAKEGYIRGDFLKNFLSLSTFEKRELAKEKAGRPITIIDDSYDGPEDK